MAFDINKLTKREKNIVGILFIILASAPFFYLTLPSWNKYTETNSQIKNDEKRIKDLDNHIIKLEKLKKENFELLKKVSTQKLFLAKSYEIDFLVEDLKKICDESSISLESFTPTNIEPVNIVLEKQLESESQGQSRNNLKQILEKLKGQDLPIDLYRLPIEVKITGNFTDIIELFKKLEKYGSVISVENISIGKVQSGQTSGDRLSKAKIKKQKIDTGNLLATFDLIAYSAAKNSETLPFNELKKNINVIGKDKYIFKTKKKR